MVLELKSWVIFLYMDYHITKLNEIFKLEQEERPWVVNRGKVKEVVSKRVSGIRQNIDVQ